MNDLILPIEVRGHNHANTFVNLRGLTSDELIVDPGEYVVTAKLPGGQEISQVFKVEGQSEHIELKPLPEDETTNEKQELYTFLGKQAPAHSGDPFVDELAEELLSEQLEMLEPVIPKIKMRLFQQGSQGFIPIASSPRLTQLSSVPTALEFHVSGQQERLLCQILQARQPALNTILPIGIAMNSSPIGCTLIISDLGNGKADIDIHLDHGLANLLTKYQERGYIQEALSLTTDKLAADDARNLLKEKMQDPVAAAAGGYALLKANQLDRLPLEWTKNLCNWFTWLPDGAVIQGELLARIARHEEALETLLVLEERGLPIFTVGLSYALNRLRQYSQPSHSSNVHLKSELKARAKQLVERFGPVGGYGDYNNPFVTYLGINPNQPNDNLIRSLDIFDGLELIIPTSIETSLRQKEDRKLNFESVPSTALPQSMIGNYNSPRLGNDMPPLNIFFVSNFETNRDNFEILFSKVQNAIQKGLGNKLQTLRMPYWGDLIDNRYVSLKYDSIGIPSNFMSTPSFRKNDTYNLINIPSLHLADQIAKFVSKFFTYQKHREAICSLIADELREFTYVNAPTVLLAHGFGGVACIDTLINDSSLQVDRLITFGSPVPFFYGMDLLNSLRFGSPLPNNFPAWTNIYDQRDPFAYVGGGIFPDRRVEDVIVNSDQIVANAHYGYFDLPQFWDQVIRAIKGITSS
jgi:hypothetical protein